MLGIRRVTDPESTMGNKNLTIQMLPELLEKTMAGSKATVLPIVKNAISAAEFARDWGNRHISHNDLALSVGMPSAKPLSKATIGEIDKALDALCKVLNSVLCKFNFSNEDFRNVVPPTGNSESLISVIAEGLRARGMRLAIESGMGERE